MLTLQNCNQYTTQSNSQIENTFTLSEKNQPLLVEKKSEFN